MSIITYVEKRLTQVSIYKGDNVPIPDELEKNDEEQNKSTGNNENLISEQNCSFD